MDQIPAAIILLLVWVGSLAIVAEVALPTMGVVGAAGAGLWGLGVWAADEQGLNVIPLLLVLLPVALSVWAVMNRAPMGWLAVSIALAFLACGLWFAADTEDWATAVGSVLATAAGFPILHRLRLTARTLMGTKSSIGSEALVGTDAEVLEWSAASGTGVVRVDGVRWNATGSRSANPGDTVRITNVDQLTVTIEPGNSNERANPK